MSNAMAPAAINVPSDAADRALGGRAWPANAQRAHLAQQPAAGWEDQAEAMPADDSDIGHAQYGSDINRYATRGIILAILLALPIWGALGLAAMWLFRP
jgi:hypothetical protein